MSLVQQISDAQKEAMKAKDAERLSTLRMLSSAIKNAQIDAGNELTDEQVQDVIRTQVKQLTDAEATFRDGGRDDLAAQNRQEIEVLQAYLPAQLPPEEVHARVAEILSGKSDLAMGPAMGMVMAELKGQADGKVIQEAVKAALGS